MPDVEPEAPPGVAELLASFTGLFSGMFWIGLVVAVVCIGTYYLTRYSSGDGGRMPIGVAVVGMVTAVIGAMAWFAVRAVAA